MSEEIYDKEIAPALLDLVAKCKAAGIPFAALVEYEPGKVAETVWAIEKMQSLTMVMTVLAIKAQSNVDRFFINLGRWCNKKGISTDQSVVFQVFKS